MNYNAKIQYNRNILKKDCSIVAKNLYYYFGQLRHARSDDFLCNVTRNRYVQSLSIKKMTIEKENCELVEMLIDSGAEDSKINKLTWEKLGRPELTPTCFRLIMASGAAVDLLGQFNASIILDQHEYELPLYVTVRDDTTNVIGWQWFPILDRLNWNSIFGRKHCKIRQISHTAKKKHDFSKSRQQRATQHYYITLTAEGVDLPMILDTGASYSLIDMAHWEKLGKPKCKLDSDRRPMIDGSGAKLDIAGICWVKVKYQGKQKLLPLRVLRNYDSEPIIGVNWFHSLNFDFNSIFNGHPENEEPVSPPESASNYQQNGRKGKCQIIQNTWAKVKAWFSAWLFEDVGKTYWLRINIKKCTNH